MFSNEIDTRDLFFSNPMDVFLAQDNSNTTKYESGISSSFTGYNQTGNSADFRSSQDLFSQKKTDSQFEATDSGYQKYISQNLLLGKNPSPKKPSPARESSLKDIKQLLEALNESVQKVNLEIGLHNDKVNLLQEQVFKLNEKVEGLMGKKVQSTDENCKAITKLLEKEVSDKISEINNNVIKVEDKVDDYTEQSQKTLKDAIKNIFKSQEISNKKLLQNIQTLLSNTGNIVENIDMNLSTSVKDIKTSFEKTSEKNMESLKNYIGDSLQQLVSTGPDNWVRNSTVQETTKFPRQSVSILQNNIYAVKNKKNAITESRNLELNRVHVVQTPPNHTPLAYYMDSHENLNRRNSHKNLRRSSDDNKDGFCFPQLNIKRKVATPLAKFVSPFRGPIIKRRSYSVFQRGYKEMTPSKSSTPAFSVSQVARLAKEYTSHHW